MPTGRKTHTQKEKRKKKALSLLEFERGGLALPGFGPNVKKPTSWMKRVDHVDSIF